MADAQRVTSTRPAHDQAQRTSTAEHEAAEQDFEVEHLDRSSTSSNSARGTTESKAQPNESATHHHRRMEALR
jgi:hypothetical protein